ncbi:MAG: hypothetical protein ACRCV9_20375 [Burkholderiaceae bacterium]
MGFDGNTLQRLEGWRDQYHAVLRWHERVRQAANGTTSPDELDFLLAFFTNCFSLRDWLLASKAVEQASIEEFFRSNVQMRLCRDIANGFKHMELRQPSVDATFSLQNEYVPKNWPGRYAYPNGKWVICADDETDWYQFGLVELADQCVEIWRDFLVQRGLLR